MAKPGVATVVSALESLRREAVDNLHGPSLGLLSKNTRDVMNILGPEARKRVCIRPVARKGFSDAAAFPRSAACARPAASLPTVSARLNGTPSDRRPRPNAIARFPPRPYAPSCRCTVPSFQGSSSGSAPPLGPSLLKPSVPEPQARFGAGLRPHPIRRPASDAHPLRWRPGQMIGPKGMTQLPQKSVGPRRLPRGSIPTDPTGLPTDPTGRRAGGPRTLGGLSGGPAPQPGAAVPCGASFAPAHQSHPFHSGESTGQHPTMDDATMRALSQQQAAWAEQGGAMLQQQMQYQYQYQHAMMSGMAAQGYPSSSSYAGCYAGYGGYSPVAAPGYRYAGCGGGMTYLGGMPYGGMTYGGGVAYSSYNPATGYYDSALAQQHAQHYATAATAQQHAQYYATAPGGYGFSILAADNPGAAASWAPSSAGNPAEAATAWGPPPEGNPAEEAMAWEAPPQAAENLAWASPQVESGTGSAAQHLSPLPGSEPPPPQQKSKKRPKQLKLGIELGEALVEDETSARSTAAAAAGSEPLPPPLPPEAVTAPALPASAPDLPNLPQPGETLPEDTFLQIDTAGAEHGVDIE